MLQSDGRFGKQGSKTGAINLIRAQVENGTLKRRREFFILLPQVFALNS
jgi:hypothetical protein